MRFTCFYLPAVATIVLLPMGKLLAQEAQPTSSPTAGTAAAAASTQQVYGYCGDYGQDDPIRDFAVRVGYWGTQTSGSTVRTGEYQSLTPSSLFYDVDTLITDGTRTLNFNATGVEDASTQVKGTYFGPNLEANLDYEQFPHELLHDPYQNWATTASGPTTTNPSAPYILQTHSDMNPGQDYAINVSELKLNLKGDVTDGLRWRVNVFSLEKSGERQADATAHCYQDPTANPPNQLPGTTLVNQCHTVSQTQYIDWKTNEIEPALEASNCWLTVEYSRTMRTFTQNDQMVYSDWDHSPSFGYGNNTPGSGEAGYAIVPDSLTEIDRLKTRVQLGQDTEAYILTYVGDEKDELNYINRHLGGVDGRITNDSIDGLTLTAHGKVYSENTQLQQVSLNTLYPSLASYYQQPASVMNAADGLVQPIDRDETDVGFSARWRPFYDQECSLWSRLSITGAYDYAQIRRTYADDTIDLPVPVDFYQPDTDTSTFAVTADERWSEHFDTYVRMKFINTAYPLYGITPYVNTLDTALNTILPTNETRMEIGGTWMPSERFLFNATFFVEDSENTGPYGQFDSTNYPFMFSFMYSPTKCWHLTAGYANFDQNLNQTINIGTPTAFAAPWTYESKSDVFNVGTTYKWSPRVVLNGNFEYVRGLDAVTNTPAPPGAVVPFNLGQYSVVSNVTYRISAGVDYLVRPNLTTFFRWNYFDYGDLSSYYNTSGIANMFLVGVNARF